MTDKQPESLRLADELEFWEFSSTRLCGRAAAELRRLHQENALLHERHSFDNREYMRVLAQRDELLSALRPFAAMATRGITNKDIDRARAGRARAEENSIN